MKLIHKWLILICIPLAFEIFFVMGIGNLLQQSVQKFEQEVHAKEVVTCIQRVQLYSLFGELLTTIMPLYRASEMRPYYDHICREIQSNLDMLTKLFEHDPAQKMNLQRFLANYKLSREYDNLTWLGPEVYKNLEAYKRLNAMMLQFDPTMHESYAQQLAAWQKKRHSFSISEMAALEIRLANKSQGLREEVKLYFEYFLLFGILANLSIAIGLAIFFGKNIEKRFRNLMENTVRLTNGKELLVPVKSNDEIAELEKALHETSNRFLEMQRFRKQLLGVVCHELKAPLSAVQILLSLLSDGTYGQLNQEMRHAAEKAENNSRRLQRMVTNLLDLEIIGLGKIKTDFQQIELDEVMQSSADMVKQLAEEKNVSLNIILSHESIFADQDRLIQVTINLLSNAIKYSPPGSTITLQAIKSDNWLEVAISDQGPGIAEDMHEAIFEAFQQADQPKHSGIKGSGLGLAICKSIIEEHQGSIGVKSTPGAGATFWFRLPTDLKQRVETDKTAKLCDLQNKNIRHVKMGFRRKGFLLIGLPFSIQLIFLSILTALLFSASQAIEQQLASREIVRMSQNIVQYFMSAESMICLQGGIGGSLDPTYERYKQEISKAFPQLLKLTTNNPVRLAATLRMEKCINDIDTLLLNVLGRAGMLHLANQSGGISFVQQIEPLTDIINQVDDYENKLQIGFQQQALLIKQYISRTLIVGLVVNFAVALFLIIFLSRNVTKRINNVIENAKRMLNREPLLLPLAGDDEIEQLDRFFHETAKKLADEQLLKQRLVAIASHELRTPLTAIQGNLGLLSCGAFGELPPEARNRIDLVEKGTKRLIELINDLLDIEKMEAGKFTLNLVPVIAKPLVNEAISVLQTSASKKGIFLDNRMDNTEIVADSEKIVRVLINLISNAIKFSPTGEAIIISGHRDKDSFIISVQDFGIGIPAKDQEAIFQTFGKQVIDKEMNPSGTGLGLAISKAIIEQHGGTIGVDSFSDKGSTFWFRLPKKD